MDGIADEVEEALRYFVKEVEADDQATMYVRRIREWLTLVDPGDQMTCLRVARLRFMSPYWTTMLVEASLVELRARSRADSLEMRLCDASLSARSRARLSKERKLALEEAGASRDRARKLREALAEGQSIPPQVQTRCFAKYGDPELIRVGAALGGLASGVASVEPVAAGQAPREGSTGDGDAFAKRVRAWIASIPEGAREAASAIAESRIAVGLDAMRELEIDTLSGFLIRTVQLESGIKHVSGSEGSKAQTLKKLQGHLDEALNHIQAWAARMSKEDVELAQNWAELCIRFGAPEGRADPR